MYVSECIVCDVWVSLMRVLEFCAEATVVGSVAGVDKLSLGNKRSGRRAC